MIGELILTQFVCFETDDDIPEIVWQDYGRVIRDSATQRCPGCGNVDWNIGYTERNITNGQWLIQQTCNGCSTTYNSTTSLGV